MASKSFNPTKKVAEHALNTTVELPSAPKAMVLDRATKEEYKDMFSSLELDLYQKLVLLNVLAEYNGPHVDREPPKDYSNSSNAELRRDFLDKLSYLCDTEKGGATVTATALQKLQHANTLWLAANEGISEPVFHFVDRTLNQFRGLTVENRQSTEDYIFKDAVKLAGPRISFYQSRLIRFTKDCRKTLGNFMEDEEVVKLRAWLKSLKKKNSWPDLVLACHQARSGPMQDIKKRVQKPGDEFDELAHYVGRLGAHWQAVRIVVTAWLQVPSLQEIKIVRIAPPADVRRVELSPETLRPYDIVMSICKKSEPNTATKHLHAFTDIDLRLDLKGLMHKKCSLVNRVHAELLLVEEFSRYKHTFVDGDKYIGCSKGACYFCFKWIVLHHKGLVGPASHNKVILGCRGYDKDLNSNGAKHYKSMLGKMISAVEQDILSHLHASSTVSRQHLSTNGSSRAPSAIASN